MPSRRRVLCRGCRAIRHLEVIGIGLVFCALSVTSSVSAQEGGTFHVSGALANGFFYGGVSSSFTAGEGVEASVEIDDNMGVGLRFGWRFSDHLTGEAAVTTFPTQIEAVGGEFTVGFDTDVTMTEGTVLYHLGNPGSRARPFLAVGGGAVSYAGSFRTEWDGMWNFGGGVRYALGDAFDLRFDLRDYMSSFDAVPPDEDARFQNHVVLSTGIMWAVL